MKNKNFLKISALCFSTMLLFGCGQNQSGGKVEPEPKTYYTVTFMNGTEVFDTKQAEANNVVAKPATDPEKEGHTFDGWYTANEGGEKWIFETDIVTKNMSLYAQFEADQVDYTVNFLLNGQVVQTKTTNSTDQNDVVLTSVAVDEGKSLLGHSKTQEGTAATDVDYRVGDTLTYASVVDLADDNNVLNLYAVVKDGEINRLNVGVWGKYDDGTVIARVMKAFKEKTNTAYDFLDYTYFEDASYHGVADFAAGILADTSIGVVFPSGSNFKDQTGVADVMKDHKATGKLVYDDGTEVTGRYITRLSDKALDVAFMDFVLSDDGKAACDPNYEPPHQEGQPDANKFVLGVWGRWYSEEMSNSLVDAFKTYATAQGVSYEEASVVYFAGATNADPYYSKANYLTGIENDLTVDVMFPVTQGIAEATDSDMSDTLKGRVKENLSLSELSIGGKNDRYLATLNEDDITKAFLAFAQTEDGKKAIDPNYNTDPVVDPQTTLTISYYGKFITEANATTVTEAVKTYFSTNSITYTSVTIDYVDATTGNNNTNYAANMSKEADISLCGASAARSAINAQIAIVSEGDLGTVQGSANRMYFAFNNGELTLACITYLTSTAGQALLSGLTA